MASRAYHNGHRTRHKAYPATACIAAVRLLNAFHYPPRRSRRPEHTCDPPRLPTADDPTRREVCHCIAPRTPRPLPRPDDAEAQRIRHRVVLMRWY